MAFGEWLKGVGEVVTENLGTVIGNAASNLFSGQAAKAKADALRAQAELEAYKTITASQVSQGTSAYIPTGITSRPIPTVKSTNMIDIIKKWWWVAALAVAGYFILGALKKKGRVKPRRRKRKSNPGNPVRKRRSGSGSRTSSSKTRKLRGRTYAFATKEDRRKYMEKVRNLRK